MQKVQTKTFPALVSGSNPERWNCNLAVEDREIIRDEFNRIANIIQLECTRPLYLVHRIDDCKYIILRLTPGSKDNHERATTNKIGLFYRSEEADDIPHEIASIIGNEWSINDGNVKINILEEERYGYEEIIADWYNKRIGHGVVFGQPGDYILGDKDGYELYEPFKSKETPIDTLPPEQPGKVTIPPTKNVIDSKQKKCSSTPIPRQRTQRILFVTLTVLSFLCAVLLVLQTVLLWFYVLPLTERIDDISAKFNSFSDEISGKMEILRDTEQSDTSTHLNMIKGHKFTITIDNVETEVSESIEDSVEIFDSRQRNEKQ